MRGNLPFVAPRLAKGWPLGPHRLRPPRRSPRPVRWPPPLLCQAAARQVSERSERALRKTRNIYEPLRNQHFILLILLARLPSAPYKNAPRFARCSGQGRRMFVQACLLSGCDYVPSLPGVGIVSAFKMVSESANEPATRNYKYHIYIHQL